MQPSIHRIAVEKMFLQATEPMSADHVSETLGIDRKIVMESIKAMRHTKLVTSEKVAGVILYTVRYHKGANITITEPKKVPVMLPKKEPTIEYRDGCKFTIVDSDYERLVLPDMEPARPGANEHLDVQSLRPDGHVSHRPPISMSSRFIQPVVRY